jgi:hypothetical protein
VGDCLRFAPFLTGLQVSSFLLWLTWLWFTDRSLLLRMMNDESLTRKRRLHSDWLLRITTDSESESELLYDWWFTTDQFVLTTSPLRFTTSNFIFQLNICSYSPYVTSSFMRGWICSLQLLLVLASVAILRSETSRTDDQILLSQIRDTPIWRSRSPYLYPPGKVWPSYTLKHWVPILSPPTTRRTTVEVFDSEANRTQITTSTVQVITCLSVPAVACVDFVVILQDYPLARKRMLASRCLAINDLSC